MDSGSDFGRSKRLLRKNQFDRVLRRAHLRTARGPLRLAATYNDLEDARLGLIVGKRMLPRAVDRNRAKRVIRESFRQACDLPAMDIVVRVADAGAIVSATEATRLFQTLSSLDVRRNVRGTPGV